ncbi:MAG: 50S ribosomal protein L5 [Gemmatimonadetes bacterium]|nr:50S ribosomal protein L5 [Gemmatimonadota bacterium]
MAKTKASAKGGAAATDPAPKAAEGQPRLQEHYEQVVKAKLAAEFGFTNPMQVPRLSKIVLNVGMGEGAKNMRLLESVAEEMGAVTGQKAVITRAKRAISNFSLRAGMPIGVRVTLRGARMYEFLDRFITVVAPRIRDFRGLSNKSFDGRGNYSIGVQEQMIFPEIDFDKVEKVHGMDITIVTTATRDDVAMALLRGFGWPFRGETPLQLAG